MSGSHLAFLVKSLRLKLYAVFTHQDVMPTKGERKLKALGYWSPYKGTTYYPHFLWLSYLIHVLYCMYSTEMHTYCRRIIAFKVCYMLSERYLCLSSFLLSSTQEVFLISIWHAVCVCVCLYYVKGRVVVIVLIREYVCVCDLDRSAVLLN